MRLRGYGEVERDYLLIKYLLYTISKLMGMDGYLYNFTTSNNRCKRCNIKNSEKNVEANDNMTIKLGSGEAIIYQNKIDKIRSR